MVGGGGDVPDVCKCALCISSFQLVQFCWFWQERAQCMLSLKQMGPGHFRVFHLDGIISLVFVVF